MVEKIYYLNNKRNKAIEAIERISNKIPMFINIEIIEMNYIKANLKAREEDLKALENAIAEFV